MAETRFTPIPQPASERVLVVDDEKSIAITLAEILVRSGYEAQYALSADEAARLAPQFVPDVLLTDLVMPGNKDGVDLIGEIRHSLPGCRAILITAHGGYVRNQPRYEKIHIVEKPVPPRDLIDILRDREKPGLPTQQHTVLLVEDREVKRYSLARWLKHNGFNVLEAENGSEALRQAGQAIDCVLLDIELPDMDGFQVCREFRRLGVKVPIIHVTAVCCEPAAQEKSRQCGADAFIAQPVEPEELVYTVRHHIQLHYLEAETRA